MPEVGDGAPDLTLPDTRGVVRLSDSSLEAARAYGVADEAGKRSRRAVFVIDTGGRILHAEPWFQPGNPGQYEAIFRALGFEG